MDLLALTLPYVAVLFLLNPWTIRRWLGSQISPRAAAYLGFSAIITIGILTTAFFAVVLFMSLSGSLLASLGTKCWQVIATGREYLPISSWDYPLVIIIGVLLLLQAGFLLGGGAKMLRINRTAGSQRKQASMQCPALRSITGQRWASWVCLILNSSDTVEAETIGLVRPRIYFSEGLVRMFTSEQLIAVVAHEEAHRAGKDNLVTVIAKAITTTLFYLPGLRSGLREMHASLEQAADERAVVVTGNPLVVAETLARISKLAVGPRGIPVSAVGMNRGDLKKRLEALVFRRASLAGRKLRLVALVVAALTALSMFAAGTMAATGPEKRAAFVCYFKHEHTPDGRCISKDPNDTPADIGHVCKHFKRSELQP